MAFVTVPEETAVLLTRAFGLLVSQAGVYGPQHNVTLGSARSVFAELEQAVRDYGPIEFSVSESRVLINGSAEGVAVAAGRNLFDRMSLYNVSGILFRPPLDQGEFLFCVGLFGTPPSVLASEGGFEAALRRAGLRSINVVSVEYQRVTGDAPAAAPEKGKSLFHRAEPAAPPAAEPLKPARPGVLDLSAALAGAAPLGTAAGAAPGRPVESPQAVSQRQRATALAAMFRNAAEVLEQGGGAPNAEVSGVLGHIRSALSEMTADSRNEISTLATQVDEDSKTIASIESAARRRGIGLKLTRGELVKRYAELNQEIVQPLTVSSGVIELLQSGKAGEINESQCELLKMAAESVDRVNQLVGYLNRITGLPESYTPDKDMLSDFYR